MKPMLELNENQILLTPTHTSPHVFQSLQLTRWILVLTGQGLFILRVSTMVSKFLTFFYFVIIHSRPPLPGQYALYANYDLHQKQDSALFLETLHHLGGKTLKTINVAIKFFFHYNDSDNEYMQKIKNLVDNSFKWLNPVLPINLKSSPKIKCSFENTLENDNFCVLSPSFYIHQLALMPNNYSHLFSKSASYF